MKKGLILIGLAVLMAFTGGCGNNDSNKMDFIKISVDKTVEDLLSANSEFDKRLRDLTRNDNKILSPILATLAKIEKEDERYYSACGDFLWGEETITQTKIVFDTKENKIFVGNKSDGKFVYQENSSDINYRRAMNLPEALGKWMEE